MAMLNIGENGSIAALRAVPTVPAPVEYTLTFVRGVNLFYFWTPASTTADDGDIIIKPNDHGASDPGRWKKVGSA